MTTQNKHTPVEWFQKPTAGHETHGQSAIYSETGSTIAVVYDGKKNASFIVRACNCHEELVAALEFAEKYLGPEDDSDGEQCWNALNKIRAALAKARGEA